MTCAWFTGISLSTATIRLPYPTQAAEAAGLQGKFWEMHDLLFAERDAWVNLSVSDFEQWVTDKAEELGLDAQQFSSDLIVQTW